MTTRRTPLAGALVTSLGEERLAELRDQLVGEIDALQLELTFVEAALKPSRRSRPANGSREGKRSGNAPGRFAGIRRDEVLEVVRSHGRDVKPADVVTLFAARGQETNVEAMRTALNRLVRDGALVKRDPSTFAVRNGSIGSEGAGTPTQTEETDSLQPAVES